MRMHRDASYVIPETDSADERAARGGAGGHGTRPSELGERHGYRNAQATVLAPTGTISFLMDCDTTGVEPDFSLVKFKELVGGGQMTIVNRTVPLALQTLGYSERADRADRGPPGRARHDPRGPGPARGAPAGVRRRRRRASDLAHGPHQDDGCRAAVHLAARSQSAYRATRSSQASAGLCGLAACTTVRRPTASETRSCRLPPSMERATPMRSTTVGIGKFVRFAPLGTSCRRHAQPSLADLRRRRLGLAPAGRVGTR